MKTQKASNIYFTVTCFTVQFTCHEKIYIFTFKVKIDHQLILSSGPLLRQLKWLFPPVAHLNIFGLKKNRMVVLKKKVHPVSRVGATETLTQVALKQNKTTKFSWSRHNIMGLLCQLFHPQGIMELCFLTVVPKFQCMPMFSVLQNHKPAFSNLTQPWI